MSGIADNPAYPVSDTVHPNGQIQYGFNGLTIREELARSAMIGLLADHKDHSDECADGESCPQTVARLAVEHADALLAALAKPQK